MIRKIRANSYAIWETIKDIHKLKHKNIIKKFVFYRAKKSVIITLEDLIKELKK